MDDEMLLDDPEIVGDEGEELDPDGLPKSKPILDDEEGEEDEEDEEPKTDESLM